MKRTFKMHLISLILCTGLGIAWVKAGILQIARGDSLSQLSKKQTSRSISYPAFRGQIYDRNGYLLSTSVLLDSIYAEPKYIKNPKKTYAILKKLFPQLSKNTQKSLEKKQGFIWIARRVSPRISRYLKQLKLDGIGFIKEEKRFYPGGSSMGQLLGRVSIEGPGLSGIEKAFDSHLQPKAWKTLGLVDVRGISIRPFLAPPLHWLFGNNVYLTLDRDIQFIAESVLEKTIQEHGAKGGWVIVLVPKTGEILAMANWPFMNPNHTKYSPNERNVSIAQVAEPGSTFKIVTFAAALDAGLLNPDEVFSAEKGVYPLGYMTIRDVVKKEQLTATEAFRYSSNIVTYKIAERVGKKKLYDTIQAFGFGQAPGIGLLEEAAGFVPKPEKWGLTRFANITFGYGFMASSFQLLQVASTIANEGLVVPPRILSYIEKPDKTRYTLENLSAQPKKRALSLKAAHQVREMMVSDTRDEGGSGKRAAIEGILVAGKTGTAEKVDPLTKRYDKKRNRSSFVGFAPAKDPEIAAIVVIDEPKGVAFGGYVAAPAWKEIVSYALIKRGILKDTANEIK